MEDKTQEEASTINVSSLTCIDLTNSNLHQSALSLKQMFCRDGERPWKNIIKKHWVSDPSKGIFACGAHTDFGMMTLLATDNVMGLQICKDKEAKPRKWEYVPSIKGSTLHRVLGNGQERYSNVFLLVSQKTTFPTIKCSTYLTQRYEQSHVDLSIYKHT
ncbi:hypothetical protein CARUB_v10019502mg [Capsella rubella]|uniref:Isopenicillin N synthase-like Fe(2+) 2OG dioxygenase domain-containing protein n=1 Tax=Capsella rubella TaxID=81985 RepID=R0HQ63_9BRAS|nr:hypothetical protein CARUB_v10019502mg [Capsella rubella]